MPGFGAIGTSTEQAGVRIGIFLGGLVGGLFFGWIVRGKQIRNIQKLSLTSGSSGELPRKIAPKKMSVSANRKSSAQGDLSGSSDWETDEKQGTTGSQKPRTKSKVLNRSCKMVLLVRMDLDMGKGKIAAQCAHAAVGAYEEAVLKKDRHLKPWRKCGQGKIALKVADQNMLLELTEKAQQCGLNTYVVRDAGRTQIPSGSLTVAAIGPGEDAVIDKITGSLKLL